jgi:hypothetical protein
MILNLTLANSRAQFAMKTRISPGARETTPLGVEEGIIEDAAGLPPPCPFGAGGIEG